MKFQYEAIDAHGRVRLDSLEAESRESAAEELRRDGLMPVRLDARAAQRRTRRARPVRRPPLDSLCLFCRQLKMLLEAGASLVPALEAVERQTTRPGFRIILAGVREKVERGAALSEALRAHPNVFDPVITTMVAAGEATATLPAVFERLGRLLDRQRAARSTLVSAAVYPLLISTVSIGVVALLLYFVVPRFQVLFTSLNHPLPATTLVLFQFATLARDWWPIAALTAGAAAVAGFYAVRRPALRAALDLLLLRAPLIGPLLCRIETARFLRIWAAMLGARLPLLEALHQSQHTVRTATFRGLLSELHEGVATGQRIGQQLASQRLVEPVVVSAVATGEEHGRLAEATDYVCTWLEEDIQQSLNRMVRLAEPALLIIIGAVVGTIAMALFMPLFDIATAR